MFDEIAILGIGLILLGPTFTMQKKAPPGERAVSEEKITPIDAEKLEELQVAIAPPVKIGCATPAP